MSITNSKLWCQEGHLNVDQSDLIQKLSREQNPKYCLETGFCTGRSALSVIYGNESNIEKFITIDINFDYNGHSIYGNGGREYVAKFESEYSFFGAIEDSSWRILSEEFFASEFPNGVDWFTVDGDHSYEGCKNDLERALPYMNKNSIMIVDDYESGPPNGGALPSVTNACNNFYKENSDRVNKEKWNKLGKGFCIFRVK